MKVLFFGSTRGTACALHYYTSLVRLGHDAIPFDPEYFRTETLAQRLLTRWNRGPTPAKIASVAGELVALCRNNAFDLVFVMAENFLGAETMSQIRQVCRRPPLFLFHSHDNVFSPGICKPQGFEAALAAYDLAFTTKSQNVARYRALGQAQAHYLPSAYEPSVHRPIAAAESRFDREFPVTFIGTYDRSRDEWMRAAGWDRLEVWGDRWERFPQYRSYRERIHPHAIYYFEFADVLSRSQCALGLLREEAQDRHTQRTFEIPACGALQLAPRNDEILGFFEEGREILCFSSPSELREKIDYALRDPQNARTIARRGYERVLQGGHTYRDRVAAMIRTAESLARPVYLRSGTPGR